jgi:hypothetical protein
MPRPKLAVESALKSKGFEEHDGDHRFFVYWTEDGKKTRARTKTSYTPKMKDIPDNLLGQMAKQVCLDTKAQFLELVNCPMSRGDYEDVLRGKGFA